MSIVRSIRCNGCARTHPIPALAAVAQVRDNLWSKGWTSLPPMDMCPECSEKRRPALEPAP